MIGRLETEHVLNAILRRIEMRSKRLVTQTCDPPERDVPGGMTPRRVHLIPRNSPVVRRGLGGWYDRTCFSQTCPKIDFTEDFNMKQLDNEPTGDLPVTLILVVACVVCIVLTGIICLMYGGW